jgi:hypothetical protein
VLQQRLEQPRQPGLRQQKDQLQQRLGLQQRHQLLLVQLKYQGLK